MSDDLRPPDGTPGPPAAGALPPVEPPPAHPLAFVLGIAAGLVGIGCAGLFVALGVAMGPRQRDGGLWLLAIALGGLAGATVLWRALRPDSARVAFGRGVIVGGVVVLLLMGTCGGCLLRG